MKPLEELYQSKSSEAQAVQEREGPPAQVVEAGLVELVAKLSRSMQKKPCAADAAVLQAILQVDPHPAAAESFVQRGGLTALSWILRRFFSTGGS